LDESYKLQKEDVEAFKLIFDYLKHLTTLSSGSILLVVTLAEKFFANSPFRGVLFLALVSFGWSILTALFSMAVISMNVGGGIFSPVDPKVFRLGLRHVGPWLPRRHASSYLHRGRPIRLTLRSRRGLRPLGRPASGPPLTFNVRRIRFFMSLRRPSFALGSAPVFAHRLGVFDVATVNRKFRPIFTSGLGAFPPVQHFPFASSGIGFKQSACAIAFPANPSNPALNPTDLMTVELTPCPPLPFRLPRPKQVPKTHVFAETQCPLAILLPQQTGQHFNSSP